MSACRFVATIVSSVGRLVDHARGHRIHELLVPLDVRKLARHLVRDLVPHHHRVPLRIALGDDGQMLARARLRQFEREAQDALDAGARHDRNVGRHFDGMALVHASAHARVLALGVLAHDHPVQVLGLAALERCIDARQDARRTHVRVLVEALADLESQAPQRDVVGNVGVPGRPEKNRILVAERVEAVGRHHHAMLAVVVAAPVEILELEAKAVAGCGDGFHDELARRNDFLSDAVTRDRRDAIGLHAVSCG